MARRKRSKSKILLPILGLVAVYFGVKYFRKGIASKLLNVKIKGLNLLPLKSANIELNIINPTNGSISFNSLTFDLSINGYPVSTLNYQKFTQIPAFSTITVKLPISINIFDSGQFLISLIQTKKIKTVGLTGTISGEGLSIPVSIQNNI
jgi:LEA14-like dessication related protein